MDLLWRAEARQPSEPNQPPNTIEARTREELEVWIEEQRANGYTLVTITPPPGDFPFGETA